MIKTVIKTEFIAEDDSRHSDYGSAERRNTWIALNVSQKKAHADNLDVAFKITSDALSNAGFGISAQRLRDLRKRVGVPKAETFRGYQPSEMCIPRDEKPAEALRHAMHVYGNVTMRFPADGALIHEYRSETLDLTPRNIRPAFRKRPVAEAMGREDKLNRIRLAQAQQAARKAYRDQCALLRDNFWNCY